LSIELKNVTVIYKNGTVGLDDVSVSAASGEFFFVVGVSGSGKSTLFRTIAGDTLNISTGDIKVNGFNYRNCDKKRLMEARRTIGLVFQNFRLIQSMTVDENLEFAMRCIGTTGQTIDRRIPEVLELVGLQNKMSCLPQELSGGEQQRVAIARAIINRPTILLADEPTGDLDEDMAKGIMDLFVQINAEFGTTCMVITHARSLIEAYDKRIVTIGNGKVVDDHAGRVLPFSKKEEEAAAV